MKVEEYRELLHEDIAVAASANYSNAADEFLLYVTGLLSAGEEFDDFVECYYEGVSRRKSMRIDGYSINDADGTCCVFVSEYRGPFEDDAVRADVINSSFKKIRNFVSESISTELFLELEESTEAYEFSRQLFYDNKDITKFRFYFLTDAYNKQRNKNIKDENIAGKKVELNVWDINRIFDLVNSQTQKESVEIVLSDMGLSGIPCVKAVEYHDIIADIEVPANLEASENDDDEYIDIEAILRGDYSSEQTPSKPQNQISYSSYLAVVPGKVLNDLYLEYGARLLEGNVRSFLSTKGKVNKSIQNTIKNYPEMFFAYNNGIAATATEIDTSLTPNGLVITRIKDLQIVNGGQTTASIANTVLTLKKGETLDLDKIYVPMKVSVLEHAAAEHIIPKISEYSNSQNKVDPSDFFSNHPFHIRMEEYSRKTPAPAVNGNQFQQYWYYERTRGQYNQGKMKFKPKSSQLKQYETKYPESQVIKMVDLAKYMVIYQGAPHTVSKGKQEIVKVFAENIKKQWAKSDIEYNPYYYKRAVALAIIFDELDDIIKETRWYKEKHSYKANVIAYTLSILFEYIRKNCKGYELDFMRIWNNQAIYPELSLQLEYLCTQVYKFITRSDRLQENVTQWCKAEACWTRAQAEKWTIKTDFIKTLIPVSEVKDTQKEAKEQRKVSNEVDDLKYIMGQGTAYWKAVLAWGESRHKLSEVEKSVLKLVCNMELTGMIPSVKQAKVVIKARQKLIDEGMPLQF